MKSFKRDINKEIKIDYIVIVFMVYSKLSSFE